MERRIKGALVIIIAVMLALCCRLYYIQVMCHEELSGGARGQYVIQINGEDERGIIYDRNMVRMTNCCENYFYILHRRELNPSLQGLMAKIDGTVAGNKGSDYVIYKAKVFDRLVNDQLVKEYGAYVFTASSRYEDDQIAAHLIGYLNKADHVGVSGLEKMYQSRLSATPAMLSLTGNGLGAPIKGIGMYEQGKAKEIQPSALVTTIDSTLQKKVEDILVEEGIDGAAIVLQAKTGQVVAMASSPSFNPNKVDTYLQSQGGELINKGMQGQYPPGSVFKIAVAAAALEAGNISKDTVYHCTGSVTINQVKLICEEKPEGHGDLDLKTAFAKSCNCYFAQLGRQVGSEKIVEIAEKLGIGKSTIEGYSDEAEGCFPSEEERSYSGLSNFSIGQGSLLVTPIQIAKMTNVIANKGVDKGVSLLMKDVLTDDLGQQVITTQTAETVGEMMKEVMISGTASGGMTHIESAGKTGSAETTSGGIEIVHGWFTGYFPADEPEYTVAILAEKGKTGSSSALPVFEKIVNFLY